MIATLAGKVALVTGGGRGLGDATCTILADAGAAVAVADLQLESAAAAATRLRDAGARSLSLRLDVGDEEQAHEAIRRVVAEWDRLDILVNNAGTDVTLPVEELSFSDFDRVLRTNLRGPFVMSKLAFSVMRRQ